MEKLTKAEEPVMKIIWRLKKVFVKEIIAEMDEPKPPYNTISSVVRLLETKGFLGHTAYGKTHQYHPMISKGQYRVFMLKSLLGDYFEGSSTQLVSNLVEMEDLNENEIKEIKSIIEKNTKA